MAKRHRKPDQGNATKLPIKSAQPAVKKGGKCDKRTPTGANVAHNAMAPKANQVARRLGRISVPNLHRALVGRRDNLNAPWHLLLHV